MPRLWRVALLASHRRPPPESFYPALEVDRLASPREGGMAVRADLDVEAGLSGASPHFVAAGAAHQRVDVERVNTFLHETPSSGNVRCHLAEINSGRPSRRRQCSRRRPSPTPPDPRAETQSHRP